MKTYHHTFVGLFVLLAVLSVSVGYCDAQEDTFTIVQMCDTQLGFGGYTHDIETFKLAVKQINAMKPDFVIICGDLIEKAGDERSVQDFLAIRAVFSMPCYCTPGNHDIGNDARPNLLQLYLERIGKDRFSFDHKGYTFVCVNTQLWKAPVEAETAGHDAWLEKALETASDAGRPVVVFGHIPLFVDKPDEPEQYFNLPLEKRRELFVLFKKHGVVAVLTGHAHRNAIHEHDGIQYVTSATTSRNFDDAPMGFRLWHIGAAPPLKHEYIAVEGASPPAEQ